MPQNSRKQPFYKRWQTAAKKRLADFLSRRPHRSFRMTRRRDYARSLQLPGYFSFTFEVNQILRQHKKLFLLLTITYILLSAVLVGVGSQESYSALTSTLRETGAEVFDGDWSQLGQAGLLFATIATQGLNVAPSESQQIFSVLIGLLVWLTTVWLLRNLLAGHKVTLRDGLYNAGAPIISTFLIGLVMVLQLLPVALALLGFSAASASGLLAGGVEAMLFWIAASLLAALSLYWITSTFIALIIVTLPGMYPLRALKTAGDMVVGRRLRILLRLLWMLAAIIVTWALILIPFILLDTWLKGAWPAAEWVPIIPVILLLLGAGSIVWSSAYVYLLYRKVVDDDAKPA
jgi:hypothetical protein